MTLLLTISDISPDTWSQKITSEPLVLGRSESADVRLEHRSVSRHHCKFWKDDSHYYIEDCGSTNGTYVNGERIKKRIIEKVDRILVGSFELQLLDQRQIISTVHDPAPIPTEISFEDPLEEERHLAAAVHQRLTPSRRLCLPRLLIESAYRCCGMLAGDCFECFELNNRWVIGVFDPMSHQTKAALTIMMLRSELQRWVSLTTEPAKCLEWINTELASLGISDLYICATLAMWFPETQSMVYSTAGAHPPILIRGDRILNLGETAGGLPLGVAALESYSEKLLQLKPGDRMYFFTDGVGNIARDKTSSGPITGAIAGELLKRGDLKLHDQVRQCLDSHSEPLWDDALIVGCEVAAD